MKKLSDEIKKLSASLRETEEKLKKIETDKESGQPDRDRLAKLSAETTYVNRQIRYLEDEIKAAEKKLLKNAAKRFDPTLVEGLRLGLVNEAARSVSILKKVLAVLKHSGAARELDFLSLLPDEIKEQAAAHDSEASKIVAPYVQAVQKNSMVKTIAENPLEIDYWTKRLFSQIMKGDFEMVSRLEA